MCSVIAALKLVVFVSFTPPMMLAQWLLVNADIGKKTWVPQLYNKMLSALLGLKITVEGTPPRSGLIVANHVSWKDIPALNAVLPLSLIAKREVGSWPLFGALARLQGTIFINRDNKRSIIASLEEIKTRLNYGSTLVLFPEATTHTGKSIKPFKSSFVAAAERTGTPVIPVTLIYQRQHGLPLTLRQRPTVAWYGEGDLAPHLWQVLKAGPLALKIVFHPPLHPADFANRKALTKAAERTIRICMAENLHAAAKMG